MKWFAIRWLVLGTALAVMIAGEQYWHLGPESGINTQNAIDQVRHPSEEGSQKVRTIEAAKSLLFPAAAVTLGMLVLFAIDLRLTLRRNRPCQPTARCPHTHHDGCCNH